MIREVLFDLGGILYDDSAWRRWLLQLLGRMGLHTHYVSFYRVWDCEFQPEVWSGRSGFWPALKRFLVATGLTCGQAAEIEAGCRARFRNFEQDIRPFPSVAETLKYVRAAGRSVAITSQAPLSSEQIKAQLGKLQLLQYVNEVRGPCLEISTAGAFRRLARQDGYAAGEAAYVGRDPVRLVAAHQADWLTVAFNSDPDVHADFCIEQFDELVGILDMAQPLRAAG